MSSPPESSNRPVLVDLELRMPERLGSTRCHVTATAGSDGSLPVVLVAETPSNPGISAHLVFGLVVAAVRPLLPAGYDEPIWIHRWDARALASVVLRDHAITRDHLMQRSAEGWKGWPIPGQLTRRLIG